MPDRPSGHEVYHNAWVTSVLLCTVVHSSVWLYHVQEVLVLFLWQFNIPDDEYTGHACSVIHYSWCTVILAFHWPNLTCLSLLFGFWLLWMLFAFPFLRYPSRCILFHRRRVTGFNCIVSVPIRCLKHSVCRVSFKFYSAATQPAPPIVNPYVAVSMFLRVHTTLGAVSGFRNVELSNCIGGTRWLNFRSAIHSCVAPSCRVPFRSGCSLLGVFVCSDFLPLRFISRSSALSVVPMKHGSAKSESLNRSGGAWHESNGFVCHGLSGGYGPPRFLRLSFSALEQSSCYLSETYLIHFVLCNGSFFAALMLLACSAPRCDFDVQPFVPTRYDHHVLPSRRACRACEASSWVVTIKRFRKLTVAVRGRTNG